MFTRRLKRGCYQPRSRCPLLIHTRYTILHGHTCACTSHTNTRTQRAPFELALTPTPSPEWPRRRACLCRQMSGRRCVFLSISLASFHLLLQRPPVCLRPCFHFSPAQHRSSSSSSCTAATNRHVCPPPSRHCALQNIKRIKLKPFFSPVNSASMQPFQLPFVPFFYSTTPLQFWSPIKTNGIFPVLELKRNSSTTMPVLIGERPRQQAETF